MRKEYLLEMSNTELDEYASRIGIDTAKAKSKACKVDLICSARERTAEISTLGVTVVVPIKKMHDKNIADRATDISALSETEFEQLAVDIIGQEQMDMLTERATDEDGSVDIDALAMALATIFTSESLKNF
ncbi:hypothetical protein ACUYFE_07505 [Olegusella massiliensis]|uniref:hypothetical protein n=1 Tax=Olegusella massiliensis TaxID=1776381 RepID=UPI0040556734